MKIKIKDKPQSKEVKEIFESVGESDIVEEKVPETEEKPSKEEEPEDVGTALTQMAKETKVPTMKEVVRTALDELKDKEVKREDVVDQTGKMIEKVNQSAVIHTIRTNEDVQKRVLESAEEQVMAELEIKRNEQMVKVVKATYNANRDACENLGLNDEGRPMWQIRIAKAINNFWFIIWAIISSFTLTPIIFFLKRIGTQVRSARLTWLLTIIFYLGIVAGIVLLILRLTGTIGPESVVGGQEIVC